MISIDQILDRHCTRASVSAGSRKRLLHFASDLLAEQYPELSARSLFDELTARERLGSTGLGEGVAIPHCRMACDRIIGACISLEQPVDFDAIDKQPVDLLFVIVVPQDETSSHLELLAALARLFGEQGNRAALRNASTDDQLYEQMAGLFRSLAA